MKPKLLLFVLLTTFFNAYTQHLKWHNPEQEGYPVVEGRGWQTGLADFYDRLPAKAKATVRKEVWSLAKNSAGNYIKFRSNANTIMVRFQVTNGWAMNHMPATGVSGVDLYAKDINGHWHWAAGNFNFDDTITYRFSNIVTNVPLQEFRLYLPLYNSLKWLQVGVADKNSFSFIEANTKAPVVLYGTSIMQGACASRPGLAWTNILGRRLDAPLVNLGFSGNGLLEPELAHLLTELDARLFVLDCQPNLYDKKIYTEAEIDKRIRNTIAALRTKHPVTPILLVEHCCGSPDVSMDTLLSNNYKWTSDVLSRVVYALKKKGHKNIYQLTAKEIGFDEEDTVDGTHPNDIGMAKYADAYEKKIRSILKES